MVATLGNGDTVTAKAVSFKDGQFKLAIERQEEALEVPVANMARLRFADVVAPSAADSQGLVVAQCAWGGFLQFKLQKIEGGKVVLNSPAFGEAEFDRSAFEHLLFPSRPLQKK
jgi:hypothetical protein